MKKLKVHDTFGIEFTYPDDWDVKQENNLISIYDAKNGFGALQFSVYRKNDNQPINLSEELEEHLKKRHEDFEIILNKKFAYSNCLDEENKLWRYWLFQNGKNIIFASYNCSLDHGGKEDKLIDEIVKSAFIMRK